MPLYEHVVIARQDLAQNQVEALTEAFTQIVTDNGGKVAKNEYWGLRNLAYRIKKNRKGHYVLLNLDAPPAAVSELERQVALNEDIIRYQTIRVDEHEEGPSAMMRRGEGRDRDDRGPRRDDRGPRPGGGGFRSERPQGGFGGGDRPQGGFAPREGQE